MNNTKAHQKLVDDILYHVGSTKLARVWPQVVGLFTPYGRDASHPTRVGMKGMADISGILCDGRRLEIECKTCGGVLSKDQKNWREMILKFSGVYIQARSVEQTLLEIEKELQSTIQSAGRG